MIEHLDDTILFLLECYRLAKDEAIIIIRCPHFSCNWFHPGHKSAISSNMFGYFEEGNIDKYGRANFEVLEVRLNWMQRLIGKRKKIIIRLLNSIINYLANINIRVAERFWCYWVGGFEELYFKIKVHKKIDRDKSGTKK